MLRSSWSRQSIYFYGGSCRILLLIVLQKLLNCDVTCWNGYSSTALQLYHSCPHPPAPHELSKPTIYPQAQIFLNHRHGNMVIVSVLFSYSIPYIRGMMNEDFSELYPLWAAVLISLVSMQITAICVSNLAVGIVIFHKKTLHLLTTHCVTFANYFLFIFCALFLHWFID